MYKFINGLYKDDDCQHCGDEWEYQCGECERVEEEVSTNISYVNWKREERNCDVHN